MEKLLQSTLFVILIMATKCGSGSTQNQHHGKWAAGGGFNCERGLHSLHIRWPLLSQRAIPNWIPIRSSSGSSTMSHIRQDARPSWPARCAIWARIRWALGILTGRGFKQPLF